MEEPMKPAADASVDLRNWLALLQPRVVEAGVEGEQIVEVDVGTNHWVALTGSGIVLVCHTGFSPHSPAAAAAAAGGGRWGRQCSRWQQTTRRLHCIDCGSQAQASCSSATTSTGNVGRPAPPQDGTPAPVHGLEHLEVLLVVAGSQQGLVLCRALQGSEAALEPQEFDDTRVLSEEHVTAASLPDPDATAPPAAVPGGTGVVVGAGGMGGELGAAREAAGAVAGGGVGSAGDKWPERVGGGASAEEQGGMGGEGAVAWDMWMKFGEEFKMLPRQGMDSSMRNPCWRVQAGSAAGSAGSAHPKNGGHRNLL
ncbi:unnamed protein product [Closterium sp. NIES-53]